MAGFFEESGLQVRRADGEDSALVRTRESYLRRRPDLVRLIAALGPGAASNGLASLSTMADDSVEQGFQQPVRDVIANWAEEGSGLLDLAVYYQLATSAVTSAQIPEQARNAWESISEVRFAEDGSQAFPHAGVYGIARSDVLVLRMKLMSILLRVQHDETLARGDITALKSTHDAGALTSFAAGADLHSGLYFLDPYVNALLGATSPGIWGFACFRGYGPVIYSLGRPVSGTSALAPELLRTLYTPGADRPTEFAQWSPHVVPAALAWWVSALNDLFGVLSDWSVFTDGDARYRPSKHLQAIATLEQLFRRVVSIHSNQQDLNARRVLLFTVLDTLQSLTGRPLETHCDADFAARTLEGLRDRIPAHAHDLLLPGAERACQALREVQDGFFLTEADGRVVSQPSTGKTVSLTEAAAQYMKILRDATHGHGANRSHRIEVTETLLARHNGHVPHDVAQLGWLYLLDLLVRPEALRSHLNAQAAKH